MNMFVVMANDFPEAAYFDEAKAKQFVAERQKEDADRVKGGFAKIYWRAYRIPVKDADEYALTVGPDAKMAVVPNSAGCLQAFIPPFSGLGPRDYGFSQPSLMHKQEMTFADAPAIADRERGRLRTKVSVVAEKTTSPSPHEGGLNPKENQS